MTEQDAVTAGQAVYTPFTLAAYDLVVLAISNRLIWRCPTPRQLAWHNEYLTARHLDVGVGTGYYLDRATFPTPDPSITLLDLNADSLARAARRIQRYRPRSIRQNALEPFQLDGERFDSVSLNYLFHCLPGDFSSKGVVLDHAIAALAPGGVVFGATLVQGDVPRNAAARRLMALYNRKGIFSNTHDTLEALRAALTQRFADVRIDVVGCGALFAARNKSA